MPEYDRRGRIVTSQDQNRKSGPIWFGIPLFFPAGEIGEKNQSAELLSSPGGNHEKPGAQQKQAGSFGNRFLRSGISKKSAGYAGINGDNGEKDERSPDRPFQNCLLPTVFLLTVA